MSPSSAVVKIGISLTGIRHKIDVRLFSGCESGCGAEAKNGGKAQEHRQKQRQAPFAGRSKHSKKLLSDRKKRTEYRCAFCLVFCFMVMHSRYRYPTSFLSEALPISTQP